MELAQTADRIGAGQVDRDEDADDLDREHMVRIRPGRVR